MAFTETLRTVVNTWECDENGHLNIQFYFAHFDTAAHHFAAMMTGGRGQPPRRLARHVRFHRELMPPESVLVRSAITDDPAMPPAIVHEMVEPVSGELVATALDIHAGSVPEAWPDVSQQQYRAAVSDKAMPRSFDAKPLLYGPDTDALLAMGGALTYRGRILPRDCDETGAALDRACVACFSDGAPHAWDHGGLETRWLRENGLGRVAVEMKLSLAAGFRSGDLVHMVTLFRAVAAKTFVFRHHLFETRTGRLAAIGDVTGLAIDQKTRRAIALPEPIRSRIAVLADKAGS